MSRQAHSVDVPRKDPAGPRVSGRRTFLRKQLRPRRGGGHTGPKAPPASRPARRCLPARNRPSLGRGPWPNFFSHSQASTAAIAPPDRSGHQHEQHFDHVLHIQGARVLRRKAYTQQCEVQGSAQRVGHAQAGFLVRPAPATKENPRFRIRQYADLSSASGCR